MYGLISVLHTYVNIYIYGNIFAINYGIYLVYNLVYVTNQRIKPIICLLNDTHIIIYDNDKTTNQLYIIS